MLAMANLLRGKFFPEDLARSLDAGANGSLGDAEDAGNLTGVEFFDSGERKRLAEFFRKAVDDAVKIRGGVRGERKLLRSGGGAGRLLGHRFRRARGAAISLCEAPSAAREEGLLILETAPAVVAVELEKGFLHDILGIVGVAQQRVGYAECESTVARDEGGEVRRQAGFVQWQRDDLLKCDSLHDVHH